MISFRSFLPSFLLVIGGISAPGTEFLLSVAAEETSVTASRQDVCSQEDMLQTVGDIFGDIGPGQRVWTGNPVPQSQCLQLINYESDDVATHVNQLTSIFGSNFPSCAAEDSDSNTCKAIQAVFDAFVALKEKGCSPIFRNYLPAWNNWHQNSTACTVRSTHSNRARGRPCQTLRHGYRNTLRFFGFDDVGSVDLQTWMVEARDVDRWGARVEDKLGLQPGSFKSLYHAQNNFG